MLFYHGLNLHGLESATAEHTSDIRSDQIPEPYLQSARAISNLLAPEGVALICCGWDQWGTIRLFEACRQSSLAIDWDISFSKGTIQDNVYLMKLGYIFLRRAMISVTADSNEDFLAFQASGELGEAKLNFSTGASDSLTTLFVGGRQLVYVGAKRKELNRRIRLLSRAGLTLIEDSTSGGFQRTSIKPLSALGEQLKRVDDVLGDLSRDSQAVITGFKAPFPRSLI